MFKNLNEIKDFITWCKGNKVKCMKLEGVEFELSEISFLPEVDPSTETASYKLSDSTTLADTEDLSQEEHDELLFWSTNK